MTVDINSRENVVHQEVLLCFNPVLLNIRQTWNPLSVSYRKE
jgi:hypothetical protein